MDVVITIVDDQLWKGTKVFRLLLSTTERRVNLNPDTTELTIRDNDGKPESVLSIVHTSACSSRYYLWYGKLSQQI